METIQEKRKLYRGPSVVDRLSINLKNRFKQKLSEKLLDVNFFLGSYRSYKRIADNLYGKDSRDSLLSQLYTIMSETETLRQALDLMSMTKSFELYTDRTVMRDVVIRTLFAVVNESKAKSKNSKIDLFFSETKFELAMDFAMKAIVQIGIEDEFKSTLKEIIENHNVNPYFAILNIGIGESRLIKHAIKNYVKKRFGFVSKYNIWIEEAQQELRSNS